MTTFILSLSLQAGFWCRCLRTCVGKAWLWCETCSQTSTLRLVEEEERADWNVRSCRPGAKAIWEVPRRCLSQLGCPQKLTCLSLQMLDNLLKSSSSDDVLRLCACVFVCVMHMYDLHIMSVFVFKFRSVRRRAPALYRCLLWFEYIQRRCCLRHGDRFKGRATQLRPEMVFSYRTHEYRKKLP